MFKQTYMGAVVSLCEDLGTPVALQAAELLRSGRHLEYLQLEIKWDAYGLNDLQQFRNDYLAVELLSKYKGLETTIDTAAVALTGFIAAEEQCRATNVRLTDYASPEWARWAPIISSAQRKIQRVIGDRPRMASLLDRFKWGKGATFSCKSEDVRADLKLLEKRISVTPQALPYLRAAMATDYAWLHSRGVDASGPTSLLSKHDFDIVRGSRGVTVPKNAKTDRFIAAEPSGNIFLQLGVGSLLRQCLLRTGVNLDDQRENQDLARVALDHGLATVDLKSASDTVAWELVWLLLPLRWAECLTALRSPEMLINDVWRPLEKFSSMGNGFTFELESLLFWSLLTSLVESKQEYAGITSVYGDDIICPSAAVPELVELFRFVGFTTNEKKTHHTGFFRESCGKHFFGGFDVTPVYQKEVPSWRKNKKYRPDETRDYSALYRARNRLFYHALDRGAVGENGTAFADSVFRRTIKLLDSEILKLSSVDLVPIVAHTHHVSFFRQQNLILDGSRLSASDYDFSRNPTLDIGLAVDERRLAQSGGGYRGNVLRFKGWSDAWVYKGLRFKAKKFPGVGGALLAITLRSPSSEPHAGFVTRRAVGSVTKHWYRFPKPGELRWI
ncbi:RNA-directed RNA polymerase [ssRNA phage SRR6960797_2]|uniref:RNA-directed RNA polymerase n=1 Tax=ssRNA phage SRR6960797_2 TaxID=2786562 RepID=A0A8S5L1Q7_9VIRU|nr:RNA-directed RNA polymerase [ssRNA phage SRR6960797_2]DAD51042.1 TPA_asm: RNA-directed RNA polymerase [ssRNA phage SRR6960797_2]